MKQGDFNPVLLTQKSEHLILSECSTNSVFPPPHQTPANHSLLSFVHYLFTSTNNLQETCSPLSSRCHSLLTTCSHLLAFLLSLLQICLLSALTHTCPLTFGKVPQENGTHSQRVSSTYMNE